MFESSAAACETLPLLTSPYEEEESENSVRLISLYLRSSLSFPLLVKEGPGEVEDVGCHDSRMRA